MNKIRKFLMALTGISFPIFIACITLTPFTYFNRYPEPIGGYDTIKKNVDYPHEARSAGIEGTVVVYSFVDSSGRVTKTEVLKGYPGTGLDEAAMDAIRKTSWKPARKGSKPVSVWVEIPIIFSLGRLTQPVPIGGYAAIGKEILYPEEAKEAGIEDSVVVEIFVNKVGNVTAVSIKKGVPDTGFDESVIAAIQQIRFKPSMFRGNPEGVWITISVTFRIAGIKVIVLNNDDM